MTKIGSEDFSLDLEIFVCDCVAKQLGSVSTGVWVSMAVIVTSDRKLGDFTNFRDVSNLLI